MHRVSSGSLMWWAGGVRKKFYALGCAPWLPPSSPDSGSAGDPPRPADKRKVRGEGRQKAVDSQSGRSGCPMAGRERTTPHVCEPCLATRAPPHPGEACTSTYCVPSGTFTDTISFHPQSNPRWLIMLPRPFYRGEKTKEYKTTRRMCPLWKHSMAIPKKIKHRIPIWSSNWTSGYIPQRNKNRDLMGSQKVEAIQVFTDRWINETGDTHRTDTNQLL